MTTPRALRLPDDPAAFAAAVRQAAALGFAHVEVAALAERPAEHLEALADSGLVVAGARLSGGLGALPLLKAQVADAARLGATWAWLPGASCGGEAWEVLQRYAAGRMVRLLSGPPEGVLVVEGHSPQTSSSTSSAT